MNYVVNSERIWKQPKPFCVKETMFFCLCVQGLLLVFKEKKINRKTFFHLRENLVCRVFHLLHLSEERRKSTRQFYWSRTWHATVKTKVGLCNEKNFFWVLVDVECICFFCIHLISPWEKTMMNAKWPDTLLHKPTLIIAVLKNVKLGSGKKAI